MSSSNYGNSADTVSNDFIKEHCPEAFASFEKVLGEAEVELTDFFLAKYFEDDFETAKEGFDTELIQKAYVALQEDFKDKTHLELDTVYHDAEERSDELNGGAWSVGGVYGLTEAGRNHIDKIEHKEWTTFG
jgi:hypothetical protein